MESSTLLADHLIADSARRVPPSNTPTRWQMDLHHSIADNIQDSGGFQSDDFVPFDLATLQCQQSQAQAEFLYDQEIYYSSLSASSERLSLQLTPETALSRPRQISAWNCDLIETTGPSTESISTQRLTGSPKAKARTISAPSILRTQQIQRGPIPATKPELIVDPKTGDEILSFSYSREAVVTIFVVKYPSQPIDIQTLPEDFLKTNCVYPRAMAPPHEYSGKRGKYERHCNTIGWTLAWCNPKIRGRRGIIQRAVDSWRNTRTDRTMRSRKARREEKQSKKVFQEKLVSI